MKINKNHYLEVGFVDKNSKLIMKNINFNEVKNIENTIKDNLFIKNDNVLNNHTLNGYVYNPTFIARLGIEHQMQIIKIILKDTP